MKKNDFLKINSVNCQIFMDVFDAWVDLREKNNKPWDVDDLDFNYQYNHDDNIITVRTPYGDDKIPLSEIYENDDLELKMLWYDDYYDGPLSGLALYNNKKVWFNMKENRYDNIFHTRTFNIYELTKEQLEEEEYWHHRFRNEVGHHTDYGDQYAAFKTVDNESIFHKFYKDIEKAAKKFDDYTKNKCLGAFNEHQFVKEPQKG